MLFFLREGTQSQSVRDSMGHVASFPAVCRWSNLLRQKGGGSTIKAFDDTFFDWWSQQIPAIEDYPYARINLSRDPDMPVPLGSLRGEIGMFSFKKKFNFNFLFIYIIFMCTIVSDNYVSIMYICGTGASNIFCKEQVASLTRGSTSNGHQTSSSIRGTSSRRG
jgi:hypothetical protein